MLSQVILNQLMHCYFPIPGECESPNHHDCLICRQGKSLYVSIIKTGSKDVVVHCEERYNRAVKKLKGETPLEFSFNYTPSGPMTSRTIFKEAEFTIYVKIREMWMDLHRAKKGTK